MSILAPYLDQAAKLGINPTQPVTVAGMALALQKADSLGLTFYKAGMERDWCAAAQLWAHKHGTSLTFQDLIAGLLHLATEERSERFLKPFDMFNAVNSYYRANIRKALGARQAPEIPHELARATVDQERDYLRLWRHDAKISGNYEHATRYARTTVGLTPEPTADTIEEKPPPKALQTALRAITTP